MALAQKLSSAPMRKVQHVQFGVLSPDEIVCRRIAPEGLKLHFAISQFMLIFNCI